MTEEEETAVSTLVSAPVLISLYVSCMVLILCGNLLVLLVVVTRRHMHTPTNYLLASLAVSDLIIGLVVIPSSIDEMLNRDASAGIFQCVVVPQLQLVSIGASIFSLVLIAIERFRAIVQPEKPRFGKRQMLALIAAVWFIALLYSFRALVVLAGGSGGTADEDTKHGFRHVVENPVVHPSSDPDLTTALDELISGHPTIEHHVDEDDEEVLGSFCNILQDDEATDFWYRLVDFIFLFVIPLMILLIIYMVIAQKLWFRKVGNQNAESTRKRRKAVKTFIVVVTLFFVCWGPFHLIELVHDGMEYTAGVEEEEEEEEDGGAFAGWRFFSIILALSNSWMNPITYAVFNSNIRNEMMSLLAACCPCMVKLKRTTVHPTGSDQTASTAVKPGDSSEKSRQTEGAASS